MTKLLKLAKRTALECAKQTGGLNSLARIHVDGTVTTSLSACCFGPLLYGSGGKKDVYFVDWPFGRDVSRYDGGFRVLNPSERRYISWIAKYSPFSKAFYTKKIDTIHREGAIYRVDMPAQFVISAAICIRYVVEYPKIIEAWDVLRKEMTPEMAFIFAHHLQLRGKYLFKQEQTYFGHQWLDWGFGQLALKHFIQHDFTFMKDYLPMSIKQDYRNLIGIWETSGNYLVFSGGNKVAHRLTDSFGYKTYKSGHEFLLKDLTNLAKQWKEANNV